MKELTPEQIQQNWERLRGIINDTFEDNRLEKEIPKLKGIMASL